MKKIVLSLLLVSLTSFENQVFVEAQKKQGKGGRPMMDGDMKKAPAGWEPPSDIPPPPPGWKPGDAIPPPPEGWTPPNEDNAPSNGKSKRGGKDGKKNNFLTGNKGGKGGKDGAKGGRPPMDGAGGKGKRPEKNEAPKMSNWKPASTQRERQIGDIIDIKDSKQIHEKFVDLNNLKIREPYFMFFMNQTCDECKKASSELAKLGKMMQDQPKIARADCTYDQEACDLFINHIDASKDVFPFMIMATSTRSYVYSGPINAQQIHDDFLSGQKYEKFPVHGGKNVNLLSSRGWHEVYLLVNLRKRLRNEKE